MSSPQNTSAVNLNSPSQYFNNFFVNVSAITADQNDALVAYFEGYTNGNKSAAQVLASSIIATSRAQGINPMATLQEFTKLPKGEIDIFLATFLNLNRVGTSYLGITNQPTISKYVQRAILI